MDGVIAGRYALGEEIGRGGMARVVTARDLRLDRAVAVKLLPVDRADDADPVGRERFVREARSSAGFSHPHAVSVFDAGEADGLLYLVMELVDGPSLAAVLAERGPLAVDEAVRITDEILQALGAAHRAGIVHRDVKPGNVLLTADGDVKLADFGIAKRLDDLSADLTSTGQFLGTPKYLSPEQVLGEPVTGASDLYSTGVLLFEMLAGQAPFDAATPVAVAMAHRDAPIPDLRSRRADGPDHVAGVVTTAMAKDPAERFGSAEQMRAALAGASRPAVAAAPLPPTQLAPVAAAPLAAAVPPARRERTQVMPDGARPGARRMWWLALLGAVAVAGIVLAALDRSGSTADPPATQPSGTAAAAGAITSVAVAETPAPTTVPATPLPTAPPTTQPPPPPPPQTLEELVIFLEADPEAYGKRGPQLYDDLLDVTLGEGNATSVQERLAKWAENGEIDANVAMLADQLLIPYISQGNGDGEGDDDDD
jgi:serine/threonine-protein kinase